MSGNDWRQVSTPLRVQLAEACMVERRCWFREDEGRQKKRGIVHRVFAARNYDGIRCLIAGDDCQFYYCDIGLVEVY